VGIFEVLEECLQKTVQYLNIRVNLAHYSISSSPYALITSEERERLLKQYTETEGPAANLFELQTQRKPASLDENVPITIAH
jgi:hypothetical protein